MKNWVSLLITSALQFLPSTLAADANAWKSRNIYFALTDRIARSASDGGGGSCSNLGNYCGGTFKGLEGKLDYIAGMGFDAIWITPVVENTPGGYHGYWAKDLYSINGNYGTSDDLNSLVRAAHNKGMYVMVDVVVNHMGSGDISSFRPDPLNQQWAYHSQCDIDYNDQGSVEYCRIAGLPDVNTGDSAVRNMYNNWISWLVKEYQFDGVRIDTVKHVEKDFWQGFISAAGVYTIGEVFHGDPDYLVDYARRMDGLLDFATYYPLSRFYKQQGSAQDLVDMHNRVGGNFPNPTAMGTFLDNHDVPRWLSEKGDTTLLKNALAYVILSRGIPIVYYGTEQAYGGGNDPANREDLWRSGFNTNSDMYKAIAKLSAAKKAAGGLAGNDHEHLYVEGEAYAWSRAGGKLVVLTVNSGSGYNRQHCFWSRSSNRSWNDVFGSGTYQSDGNGYLCVQVNNGQPVVLLSS